MIAPNDVLIVLPAYNEEKVLSSVLKGLKKAGFNHIVVVDDCSTDQTSKVAEREKVVVLRHVINRGAGAATATGLAYAKEEGFKYALTMDSDGQHKPSCAQKLLRYADRYDVVIGSRWISKEGEAPLHRRIVNEIGNWITFIFFGLYVHDSQSGMKLFNEKALENIRITFDRYEFCSEVIGEIAKHKLFVKEVPIEIVYTDHSLAKGQSLMNGVKMLFRFIFRV